MILDSVDFKNEDIIIADPSSIVYFYDWQKYFEAHSNNGYWVAKDLKKIGFKKAIGNKATFKDFGCMITRIDINGDKIELGDFYIRLGTIAVFSLDEVLKYKPHYDIRKEKETGYAVRIENFTGRVSIERVGNKAIIIVGQGSTDFYSEIME